MKSARVRRAWACLGCHSLGHVYWIETGNLYRLRQNGTRGAKVGTARTEAAQAVGRFGALLGCDRCGALLDLDQTTASKTTSPEDIRVRLEEIAR